MAFVHVNKPSGTGFFVFPIDEENLQSQAAHDFARTHDLALVGKTLNPKAFELLRSRVGGGRLHIVGLWSDDSVMGKWEVIAGGETIFFVTKRALVGSGTIVHSERSRALAEQAFGRGTGGHELLIFVVDVALLDLPIAKFNEALGRRGASAFRGFATLSGAQIRKLEEAYGSFFAFLEAAKAPEEREDGDEKGVS